VRNVLVQDRYSGRQIACGETKYTYYDATIRETNIRETNEEAAALR
jgi:hypothetical protein